MASKASKKNKMMKELRGQNKAFEKKPQKKKSGNTLVITIIGVILLAGIIFWIASSTGKQPYIPLAGNAPSTGPETATVTFLEFGCYTCPYTKGFNLNVLPQLMKEYEGRVNFVFRSVPIPRNAGSSMAAEASKCANDQGLFWDYSDLLFRGGSSFDKPNLRSNAIVLGMDMEQFDECLNSGKYSEEVKKDYNDAKKAGVSVTPTVFINGVKVPGTQEISLYRRVLNDMLEGK